MSQRAAERHARVLVAKSGDVEARDLAREYLALLERHRAERRRLNRLRDAFNELARDIAPDLTIG